jgi:hypothetical protein
LEIVTVSREDGKREIESLRIDGGLAVDIDPDFAACMVYG